MDYSFNIKGSQQYKSSRNPNFKKQVENYEKNKMHSLAISVMNLISLFNSSSNENNNNISAMNVLSKIKTINESEINKDEINDENIYGNYMDQIGGNIDKGRISQSMLSNNNNYPGRPILERYNYYYKQLKGENALEETAFQNMNDNNNNFDNINIRNDNNNHNKKIINVPNFNDDNGNGYEENFDDNNNNVNPLQGKLRNNYNNNYNDNKNYTNDNNKNYNNDGNKNYNNNFSNNFNDNFNNNYSNNFNNNDNNNFNNNNNKQTIIQFNDYMIRSNNLNKYSENQ